MSRIVARAGDSAGPIWTGALRAAVLRSLWPALVVLAAVALCAPFMHAIFWLGDEGVLLAGAERILHGETLYRDFFEFLPPGGFLLIAGWFAAAGISLWSARLLAVLTIAGIACFTYLACRRACRNAIYPALLVLGWLLMTQGYWTEISHHWFTTLLSMIAAAAALHDADRCERSWHAPLVAGFASGAAAMVVPTRGTLATLAGIAGFAGSRRQLLLFCAATSVVPLAILGYLLAQGSATAAFQDAILFTGTRYAAIQRVPFGYFATPQDFPFKYLFPVTAVLAVLCYARDWRGTLRDRRLRCCTAFGIAAFAGILPRADTAHMAFASPLLLPLFADCTARLTAGALRRFRVVGLVAILLVLTVPAISFGIVAQQALEAPVVATPRGPAAFLGRIEEVDGLTSRLAALPAEENIFFYPYMPVLPFLTGRRQVSDFDLFTPGYTLPSQYREACIAATQHAAWVVFDRRWTDPEFLRWVFPAMRDTRPPETQAFERALDAGFATVATYGSFELRQATSAVSDALCAE